MKSPGKGFLTQQKGSVVVGQVFRGDQDPPSLQGPRILSDRSTTIPISPTQGPLRQTKVNVQSRLGSLCPQDKSRPIRTVFVAQGIFFKFTSPHSPDGVGRRCRCQGSHAGGVL